MSRKGTLFMAYVFAVNIVSTALLTFLFFGIYVMTNHAVVAQEPNTTLVLGEMFMALGALLGNLVLLLRWFKSVKDDIPLFPRTSTALVRGLQLHWRRLGRRKGEMQEQKKAYIWDVATEEGA